MTTDLKAQKIPGSWLCAKGWTLRETYNLLQRQNGTSLMRHKAPSEEERKASIYFDSHVMNCPVCMA